MDNYFILIFIFILSLIGVIVKRYLANNQLRPFISENICIYKNPTPPVEPKTTPILQSSTQLSSTNEDTSLMMGQQYPIISPDMPCLGFKKQSMPPMSCGTVLNNIDVKYD